MTAATVTSRIIGAESEDGVLYDRLSCGHRVRSGLASVSRVCTVCTERRRRDQRERAKALQAFVERHGVRVCVNNQREVE